MELTAGQQQGLEMARRLASEGYRGEVGVLVGYAGTGKTFLTRVISEETGMPLVLAPTGRAAARVRELTGIPASTIHRWLYTPIEDRLTGEIKFIRKNLDDLDRGESGLIIIDEASMVGSDLWSDLYETAVDLNMKIICVGDGFQLPPVADEGFSLLDDNEFVNQRVVLTEIHRQAKDSPIIRASMLIRSGDIWVALKELPTIKIKDFLSNADEVVRKGGVTIVHRNTTRHKLNTAIRKMRGLADKICFGEPLLILKNQYSTQCFNGEMYDFSGWTEQPAGKHVVWDRYNKKREESRFGLAYLHDSSRDHGFDCVLAESEVMGQMGASPSAIQKTAGITHPLKPYVSANFGYCLSGHKSQGCEWEDVLVGIEPSLRFQGKDQQLAFRWLYTAICRAKTHVLVCLGVPI